MIEMRERPRASIAIADHDLNALRFAARGTTTLLTTESPFMEGLLPDTTSDIIENTVDRMVQPWFDEGVAYVVISIPANFAGAPPIVAEWAPTITEAPPVREAHPVPETVISVAEVAQDLRDKLDLPVQDLAAMVGLSRRRYYDLLNGANTTREVENRMNLMQLVVHELSPMLRDDPRLLRSAVLMPIGPDRMSLYEAGASGDAEAVAAIGSALLDRFRGGRIRGLGPRPIPRIPASDRGRRLAREAIEDAPLQHDEEDEEYGGGR